MGGNPMNTNARIAVRKDPGKPGDDVARLAAELRRLIDATRAKRIELARAVASLYDDEVATA
jgi:hypothetical protein